MQNQPISAATIRSRLLSALAWSVIAAVLAGCAFQLPFLGGGAAEVERIATDNGMMTARYVAATPDGSPTLTREQALARAAASISETTEVANGQAREVLLTIETETGDVVSHDQHVWVVTYDGLAFEPNLGCACYKQVYANTAVALDAQTGELLLIYGVGKRLAA